jgi:transmembrane sensor
MVTGILVYIQYMEEEKFWELVSLQLSGEATDEELAAFDCLLNEYPHLDKQWQVMQQLWKKHPAVVFSTDDFYNRHLQRLGNRPDIYPPGAADDTLMDIPAALPALSTTRIRRWLLPLSGIAAAVIVAWVLFNTNEDKKNVVQAVQNTISTRKGSKSNIVLPDGSKAWLNADSKLTYSKNFQGKYREVSLEGEAYFDVVKDKNRPFIIHTKTIDIRVLGTAFNVRAYATEKNTETALYRGSVEVTLHSNPGKKIVLKPNEKLMVNNNGPQPADGDARKKGLDTLNTPNITVRKVHFQPKDSSALETLWMKNKLVLDAETLEEVAGKIERWYNVAVLIRGNEKLKKTTYSAIFENENLAEVMEALKITGNFNYTINKGIVQIK